MSVASILLGWQAHGLRSGADGAPRPLTVVTLAASTAEQAPPHVERFDERDLPLDKLLERFHSDDGGAPAAHVLWQASQRGLLHATPTLRRLAVARVPLVLHVHAALAPPLQALYDAQVPVLSSGRDGAAEPLLRAAHALASLQRVPVVHVYAGRTATAPPVAPLVLDHAGSNDNNVESLLRRFGVAPLHAPTLAAEQPSLLLLIEAAHAHRFSVPAVPSVSVAVLAQVLPPPVDCLRQLLLQAGERRPRLIVSVLHRPAASNWSPLVAHLFSDSSADEALPPELRFVVLASSDEADRIDADVLRSLQQLADDDSEQLFADSPYLCLQLASLRTARGDSPQPGHRTAASSSSSSTSALLSLTDDRLAPGQPEHVYDTLLRQLFDGGSTRVHRATGETSSGQLSSTFGRLLAGLQPGVCNWLVAGSELEYDEGLNAIHNIFSNAALKVKLLIVDDTPLGCLAGTRPRTGRRDVGLYAVNYGTVYVASVSLYASYPQTVQALSEAADYDGSAVVLAYLPAPHADDDAQTRHDPLTVLRHSKQAVDSGVWPLYRYNPRAEPTFELDSKLLRQQLGKFVERERKLALLLKESAPATSSALASSVDGEVRDMHRRLLETSLRSLVQGLGGGVEPRGPIVVLFASDGGNAAKAARSLGETLRAAGYEPVAVQAMDDVGVEAVLERAAGGAPLVFCVSTAGQGEFPSNGKSMWAALRGRNEPLPAGVRAAVFGLGDSHYWPRAEDAHYFCKPAVDLHATLARLGAELLVRTGLGDDQAAEQWRSDFALWRSELLQALGCGDVAATTGDDSGPLPPPDVVKRESNYLRGSIAEGLLDESTGALAASDTLLTKFHGIYQQDDRDLREARRRQNVEPAYSFMIRVRAPGGTVTPAQWLAMDAIADRYAGGQLRLTTRQAVQFHGVIKRQLKTTVQAINATLMDTLAACGDVNRNVMCTASSPGHVTADVYQQIQAVCQALSDYLTPRTTAYHEIWLDKTPVAGQALHDVEPIYGPTYLPRKFKIAVAIPPSNDVDVYAGDLGFVAIVGGGGTQLEGFNVVAGGGMGMTHNAPTTYPKTAQLMGFCTPDQVLRVAEGVVLAQRDNGNRENRKRARLKYTMEERGGVAWLAAELAQRTGVQLQPIRPFHFTATGDEFGWRRNARGLRAYCVFVENGRVKDLAGRAQQLPVKTGLREIARLGLGSDLVFRLTPNQSLIVDNVADDQFAAVERLLDAYSLSTAKVARTAARLNSMACVALPTCGLALSESERFLPHLMDLLDRLLHQHGLADVPINVRMSGCPNGCSRPYLAEIALVGRAPGIYNLYLGASHNGDRLSALYADGVTGDQVVAALAPIFERFAAERLPGEHFGDFTLRMKYVNHTNTPVDFHPINF